MKSSKLQFKIKSSTFNFKFSTLNLHGFTLIELTIITAVIGVLGAMVIMIVNPIAQIDKSQDAKRKSDLSEIQKALDLYYQDNGRYPASTGTYQITNGAWGGAWSPYMGRVPRDPTSGKTYIYYASNDGQANWLYANLAQGARDTQACTGGNNCPNVPAPNLCGSSRPCNYGVSGSNVSP